MNKPVKKVSKAAPGKPTPATSKGGSAASRAAPPAIAALPAPPDAVSAGPSQAALFDRAMSAFHRRDFTAARGLFEKAVSGPHIQMAHVARQHLRMCDQRLSAEPPPLATPEEKYYYGIALLNRRDLDKAEPWLQQALDAARDKGADADHLYYALALLYGLRGDLDRAVDHLRRAIQIQPRNRVVARNDPDFAELSRCNAIHEILFPERDPADS